MYIYIYIYLASPTRQRTTKILLPPIDPPPFLQHASRCRSGQQSTGVPLPHNKSGDGVCALKHPCEPAVLSRPSDLASAPCEKKRLCHCRSAPGCRRAALKDRSDSETEQRWSVCCWSLHLTVCPRVSSPPGRWAKHCMSILWGMRSWGGV